jgi:[acyl-carrier-protein] S-malonyltransferase
MAEISLYGKIRGEYMKKNNVVFLFPGQGAQSPGMALDFYEASGAVKSLFDTASDVLGKNAKELLQSEADVLKRTDVSQPAITLANLAAAVYLGENEYVPAACAGFSLGEYAALVCSGVISAADCFRLVKVRGEAMQKTSDALREAGAPGMAAVIGLAPDQVEALIAQWGLEGLYAANINSTKQLVVSGTAAALSEAEVKFKEAGAKRVIRLQVAGPFHSPLMAGSVEEFRPALEAVTFNDPVVPLFSNVTGKQITSGAEAKELAIAQITSPVRWVEEEAAIEKIGADACLETGPGKVLQGLWRDTGSQTPCYLAGTIEDQLKIGIDQ